ncbi:hypothetical protein HMH01_11750 [Halovulum dunhuangense]|uniref:Uncharacterized protein n=1 Tax=Halovulum dunhuangense TaxID=1505036 RepID=A0A849L450_9RHOB|nr:hypothetical protein [Halovulum dunhuangense]NNU81109.1 hypothetical protein [Halovulum dunhuangense]
MPIAIFFLILAGALAVAVLYPHMRPAAAVIGAFAGALLGWVVTDRVLAPDPAASGIAVEKVALSDLVLSREPRLSRISGRVTNLDTDLRLADFTLRTTLYDCPEVESALEDCAVIGQDAGIARVDLPAGQTRAFHVVMRFADMPEPAGVLRWDHAVTQVRAAGQPVP